MPSKITKLASSVVQMPIDYISVTEASYIYVHYKILVSYYAPDHIWSCIGAISEMACIHRSKFQHQWYS